MIPKLVYVLTTNGLDLYADMALVSMLSLSLSNPDITIVLLVDSESLDALQRNSHILLQISDSIVSVDTPSGSGVFRSRWLKTQVGHFIQGAVIFLDSDTLVRRPIDWPKQFNSLFGAVADAIETGAWKDSHRLQVSEKTGWNPQSTYYNSGFFYYLSSPAVEHFFDTWHSLWQGTKDATNDEDQPSFNAAITLSDLKLQELPESFNHQINLSWNNCQQSTIWHFWASSRMSGDILDELTRSSADLSLSELSRKVHRAITKRTPAAYSNRLARAMDLLSIDPELQRKLLIQQSRLSTREFLRWSLLRLVGRSAPLGEGFSTNP